ncbi:MAG: hypothetical protein ACLPKI_21655 [Streptosporangiaceae bacterium]
MAEWARPRVGPQSVRRRRIIVGTWAAGYVILLLVQAAISGSVSPRTLAFVAFAGPVLLAGLTCILAAALGRNWPALGLGAWLVIAGASCAGLAPATILAVCSLAGGGAFLLMAVTVKSGSGVTARATVSLSRPGRQALDAYTAVLRQLLDSASSNGTSPH